MTGEDLKAWRAAHGNMSQRRLAELTGSSWQTISNYETDRTTMSRGFRLALAAIDVGLPPVGDDKNGDGK